MKYSKLLLSTCLLAATCFAASSATTASKGGGSSTNQGATPNGKPFVQIHNELDGLQSQIDVLVGAVDSLEDRVAGLEGAVADLQAETAALDAELEELAVDVEANEAEMRRIADMMVENQNMIALMQDQLEQLEAELAKKQDIVDGTCPEGSALSAINPDGSVVCRSMQSGISKFTVNTYVKVPKGRYEEENCNYSYYYTNCYTYTVYNPQTRTATATCPTGSFLVGGSSDYSGLTLRSQGESPNNNWTATATNYSYEDHYLFATAVCISVN
jgi:uncharacterized small protein (DUF1192 family)